eukprot:TRINITY_DN9861_c0_g1_i1.p1 TRINITY_DN9861_c0_g1~~TRINITY_DN9861_c0_g1_i1.p1  ORF type:complete len:355 (-),score=92.79 TRINITY_DN9861_c0_g1_i1:56-1030(-)
MENNDGDVWIFGYGSLIYKNNDFKWKKKTEGYVKGYVRRFFQGSTDHRGTEENPGRVVTLLKREEYYSLLPKTVITNLDEIEEETWGVAFCIDKDDIKKKLRNFIHKRNFYNQSISKKSMENNDGDVWIFGYGSLIYKNNDFKWKKKTEGYVKGYVRRFFQGSTDHRGTEENPGRVVTLLKREEYYSLLPKTVITNLDEIEEETWGVAFCIDKDDKEEIFSHLDHREKDGYSRYNVDIYTKDNKGEPSIKNAITFVATTQNIRFTGYHDEKFISDIIYRSAGPSGQNKDYLYQLYHSLLTMGVNDPHIFSLYNHVKQLEENSKI